MADDKTLNYLLNKTVGTENAFSVILTDGNTNMDKIDELIKTQETNLETYITDNTAQNLNIVNAETVRISNEVTRISEHVIQTSESITATSNANEKAILAETATNRANAVSVWEEFNPLTPYLPLNKVSLNGDSFINIVACTGIYPSNETNWLMIAKHGSNGFSSILES